METYEDYIDLTEDERVQLENPPLTLSTSIEALIRSGGIPFSIYRRHFASSVPNLSYRMLNQRAFQSWSAESTEVRMFFILLTRLNQYAPERRRGEHSLQHIGTTAYIICPHSLKSIWFNFVERERHTQPTYFSLLFLSYSVLFLFVFLSLTLIEKRSRRIYYWEIKLVGLGNQ